MSESIQSVSPKKVGETVRITYQLRRTVSVIQGIPSLQVSVYKGKADADTATMLSGIPTVEETKVKVLIRGGMAGNTYLLRLVYSDGEQLLFEDCLLDVL